MCNDKCQPAVKMDLFKEVVKRGIPYDSHQSDLYIPSTEETKDLVKKAGCSHSTFKSNTDGKFWIECPFQYSPYWEKLQSKS